MLQNTDIDRDQFFKRLQSLDDLSIKKPKDGIVYDLDQIRKVLSGEENFTTPPNEQNLNSTFNLDDSFLQSNTKELDKINMILKEKLADDRRLTSEYDNLKFFMDSVLSIFHISSNDIGETLNDIRIFFEKYMAQEQLISKMQDEIAVKDTKIDV